MSLSADNQVIGTMSTVRESVNSTTANCAILQNDEKVSQDLVNSVVCKSGIATYPFVVGNNTYFLTISDKSTVCKRPDRSETRYIPKAVEFLVF